MPTDPRNVIIEYPVTLPKSPTNPNGRIAGERYAVRDAETAARVHPDAVILGFEGPSDLRINEIAGEYFNDRLEVIEGDGWVDRTRLPTDIVATLDAVADKADVADVEALQTVKADAYLVDGLTTRVAAVEAPIGRSRLAVDVAAAVDQSDTRVFDVRKYGAVGDGTADDTAALQACADACKAALGTYFIPATMNCKITSQLDLRYIRSVQIEGRIEVAHTTGTGVRLGGSSLNTGPASVPIVISINDVHYAGTQTNVAIQVVGLKNATLTINSCPYLQLYADVADPTIGSVAYCNFYFGKVDKHELLGEAGQSWINENRFHGGRVTSIIVSGAYPHNNNRWYDSNLESSTITFNVGSSNYIRARLESGAAITFATGTHSNEIEQTYYAADVQVAIATNVTVTDSGFGNRVYTGKQAKGHYVPVVRIDSASRTTDQCSEWPVPHATARIRPGFRKLKLPTMTVDYVDTGIFAVETTNPAPPATGSSRIKVFHFVSDASIWRPIVRVFDANRQPLDGSSTAYMSLAGVWAWVGSTIAGYTVSSNQGTTLRPIVLNHPDVKYAQIILRGNDTATPFGYVELSAFVQAPSGDQLIDTIKRQMARPLYKANTTVPTQSLLQAGDAIGTSTGRHLVISRVDTALAVAAVSTDATVTVASATGMLTGDNIAILLDDDTTHFTTINGAPAGNVVTLTAAMPGAAAVGKNVATNRFLHIT